MKQFILAALLCISAFGIAQNETTTGTERTIIVYGSAEKPLENVTYKTEITLTLDNGYYDDGPYKTLDELLAKYYAEVKGLSIDTSKFTRDDLAYAAAGYRKEGTILKFETKNKKDIIKLTSVNMSQVTPSYILIKSKLSEAEIKFLTTKALEDARKNAEILAEVSGVKIDKIFSISSSNLGSDTYWRSGNTDPEYYRLTVVYTLKELK